MSRWLLVAAFALLLNGCVQDQIDLDVDDGSADCGADPAKEASVDREGGALDDGAHEMRMKGDADERD
jgi:hypothetical protein